MKPYFIIFILIIPTSLFAITSETLKKYPYQLLTNDYGILNEANLKRYTYEINVEPFTGKFNGLDYWQCYPTKNLSVWYEKQNDDPYEKTERGDAHITIRDTSTTMHDYVPRRSFSSDYAKEKVSTWKHLLKNQQYACIGGIYVSTHKKMKDGKEITEHGWIFENLKTKKGCDSYFSGWCR